MSRLASRRWTLASQDDPGWVHVITEQDEPYIEPIPLGETVVVMPVTEHEALLAELRGRSES